jgi:glycerophosphoryl diester phosphodiesterase
MIELDVQLCRSGEPVVIHDDTLERTTDGSGAVARKTFDELRELDAGKGERIPTLDEVADLVGTDAILNIELKGAGTALPVAAFLAGRMKKHDAAPEQFLVSSFSAEELSLFRRLNDAVPVGVLAMRRLREACDLVRSLGARSLHLRKNLVTGRLVREVHAAGRQVLVWTADTEEEIRRLAACGVDGIFSNYPDRIP